MSKETEDYHPVKFTRDQIAFLEHMISEVGYDYFEEECVVMIETIKKYE